MRKLISFGFALVLVLGVMAMLPANAMAWDHCMSPYDNDDCYQAWYDAQVDFNNAANQASNVYDYWTDTAAWCALAADRANGLQYLEEGYYELDVLFYSVWYYDFFQDKYQFYASQVGALIYSACGGYFYGYQVTVVLGG